MPSAKLTDTLEKDKERLKATNWQLKGQHELEHLLGDG